MSETLVRRAVAGDRAAGRLLAARVSEFMVPAWEIPGPGVCMSAQRMVAISGWEAARRHGSAARLSAIDRTRNSV